MDNQLQATVEKNFFSFQQLSRSTWELLVVYQ